MEQVSELSLCFLRPPIVAVSLDSKLQLKGKFQRQRSIPPKDYPQQEEAASFLESDLVVSNLQWKLPWIAL